jgi:hypothetical protein
MTSLAVQLNFNNNISTPREKHGLLRSNNESKPSNGSSNIHNGTTINSNANASIHNSSDLNGEITSKNQVKHSSASNYNIYNLKSNDSYGAGMESK